MSMLIPKKLQQGDEIRVISPARSMSIINQLTRDIANKRFSELGLKLSFSDHVEESDDFDSSSISSRIKDLHDAFLDDNVKGVLTTVGGYNSNQLLREVDWQIIKDHPKIFCGFSDITALNNAMLARAGLVTYYGPHYSSFGMKKYFDYTLDYFKKCLMNDGGYDILPSDNWSDDAWFLDQENRSIAKNDGWLAVHEGEASGQLVGGNLCTLNLLQGTEYMPNLEGSILLIEDTSESKSYDFDRDLVSLIQQPGFEKVRAIIIGRFQKESHMSNKLLTEVINSKKELNGIPVLAGVDFGHTTPIATLPIGGSIKVAVSKKSSKLSILTH